MHSGFQLLPITKSNQVDKRTRLNKSKPRSTKINWQLGYNQRRIVGRLQFIEKLSAAPTKTKVFTTSENSIIDAELCIFT